LHCKLAWWVLLSFLVTSEGVCLAQEIVGFSSRDGKRIYSNTEEIYRLVERPATKIDPKLIVLDQNAEPSPEIEKLIQEISQRHGVDPELVKAVAKAESNFNPRAVSYKGALGIMQLIPETAKRFGVTNVWDPKQNIEGGVRFLKFLIDMFPDNLPYILAAYNAGENAVLKYRGIPPYRETQAYIRKITQVYKGDHFLIVSSRPEQIVSYRDDSGRVIHSNLDNAHR
jgi:Transglycosylase SLT domain